MTTAISISDKTKACLKCGGPIADQAPTGRPKKFCGEPCKRAAGYELTRINRRLQKLEERGVELRIAGPGFGHLSSAERRGDLKKVQVEIDTAEARLLQLLADEEEG